MRVPPLPPTVSAAVVCVLADAIEHAAPDGRRELDRIGVPRDLASDVSVRVAEPLVVALFERGPIITRDDAFGLHAGEQSSRGRYGFAEYFIASSGTLGEALERLAEHYRLLSEAGTVALHPKGEGARLTFVRHDRPPLRHEAEFFVSAVLAVVRRAVGRTPCPTRTTFEHGRPADTREHVRILGDAVDFGAACTAVELDARSLALPLVTADDALGALLRPIVIAAERNVPRADIATRVRLAVRRALPANDVTVSSLARTMAMSARSLQRALAEHGTSAAELVDEVRREYALELLEDPRQELGEIAAALGFARTSAFHRAFRRWTASTPNRYRRRQAASSSEPLATKSPAAQRSRLSVSERSSANRMSAG